MVSPRAQTTGLTPNEVFRFCLRDHVLKKSVRRPSQRTGCVLTSTQTHRLHFRYVGRFPSYYIYSRITSRKSTSFCATTFSVPRILRSSHPSHVTAAATSADQCRHLHRSDCSSRLTNAHTTSRILSTCEIRLGSLTLRELEAGDFAELLQLSTKRNTVFPKIIMKHNSRSGMNADWTRNVGRAGRN